MPPCLLAPTIFNTAPLPLLGVGFPGLEAPFFVTAPACVRATVTGESQDVMVGEGLRGLV